MGSQFNFIRIHSVSSSFLPTQPTIPVSNNLPKSPLLRHRTNSMHGHRLRCQRPLLLPLRRRRLRFQLLPHGQHDLLRALHDSRHHQALHRRDSIPHLRRHHDRFPRLHQPILRPERDRHPQLPVRDRRRDRE